MKNRIKKLTIITAAAGTALLTACSSTKQYLIYDQSQDAAQKGCVDFYTTRPEPSLRYYPTMVRLYDAEGNADTVGYVGDGESERIRVVLPAGSHTFKYGSVPKFHDLTVNIPKGAMVPVEVVTEGNPALMSMSVITAALAIKSEAKVGSPQTWNPSDYAWKPVR